MNGNIYTSERCHICKKKLRHDERRNGVFCPDHPEVKATKRFTVKFPAKPKSIQKRFNNYPEAARFLTALRFKKDEGTLDPRDYRSTNPLGFENQVEIWLSIKRKQQLSKSAIWNTERNIGRALAVWGNRNIKTISDADIEDFLHADHVNARNGGIISSKTRADLRATIQQFFKWVCRREKISMPDIPPISFELGWRNIVDIPTQQTIINKVKEISFSVNPKIWLGIHILSHNSNIRPGELVKIKEQDVLIDQALIHIKHAKEGSLKPGKFAELWDVEIEVIKFLPKAIPTLPYFRHVEGLSGIKAGESFGPTYFSKWWKRACNALGIEGVGLYAGTKHSTMTALSRILSPEQIRRGGSKHTSKAIERYLLPDRYETELVQKTLQDMQQQQQTDAKIIDLKQSK